MTTTPRRRYPASLSHNPSGPSRPATRAPPADEEEEVPQLFSLEHLLQQAGYKETRVFTPEGERKKLDQAAELADLYRSMGLDPEAPIHVRHLTKPTVPFRSSSSVLRNIALQDADATINKHQHQTQESWWGSTILGRAAETVGKSVSAMSPPSHGSPEPPEVGLGLAKGGNGVRKVMSNWELGGKSKPAKSWNGEPPPSLAGLFSPPETAQPRFDDDAFGDDMFAYGEGLPSDVISDGSVPSSLESQTFTPRESSPPLLDTADVFADLGLTSDLDIRREEIAAVGRRVLASTIEYDEADDLDTPPSPTSASPVLPILALQQPTPDKQTSRLVKEAIRAELGFAPASPTKTFKVPKPLTTAPLPSTRSPASPSPAPRVRAAKSTPVLGRRKPPPLRITPATAAPPTVQSASPIVCDSLSSAAEDLPPLPMPYMPESPPPTSTYSTLTLKARKSLSALRAYWNATPEPTPAAEPQPDVDCMAGQASHAPILTPRIDWESQGFNYAGWNNKSKFSQHKSRDSTGTMAEFGDPFLEAVADIDYTKSFFYKPGTPPRAGTGPRYEPRKQQSIKSLRAALRIPVAPPVPPIPEQFKKRTSTLSRTPPMPIARLAFEPPAICIHSPGALEDGRPPTPLVLEGAEWDGHDVVKNWGKGVRKGKGKTKARSRGVMSYDLYDWD